MKDLHQPCRPAKTGTEAKLICGENDEVHGQASHAILSGRTYTIERDPQLWPRLTFGITSSIGAENTVHSLKRPCHVMPIFSAAKICVAIDASCS